MKTAQDLYDQASDELELLDKQDLVSWTEHPVTKSLGRILLGDYMSIQEEWTNGVYTTDTCEGTAMKNAKALGEQQTISNVLELLDSLKRGAIDVNTVRTSGDSKA